MSYPHHPRGFSQVLFCQSARNLVLTHASGRRPITLHTDYQTLPLKRPEHTAMAVCLQVYPILESYLQHKGWAEMPHYVIANISNCGRKRHKRASPGRTRLSTPCLGYHTYRGSRVTLHSLDQSPPPCHTLASSSFKCSITVCFYMKKYLVCVFHF